MFDRRRQAAQGGYTILEVLITMAVLVVATQAFSIFMRTAAKDTTSNRLKAEANEHALQMLEELRSVVANDATSIKVLDSSVYNDGRNALGVPNYKFTLTTKADVTHPGGNTMADYTTGTVPLSSNPLNKSGYTFVRQTDIIANALDVNTRQIYVRVWAAAANLGPTAPSTATPSGSSKQPLAEVYGTVHSLIQGSHPTQVMDVYLIELENVPGWWSRTSNLIPLMDASLISLQANNPGLVLRSHSIRRLSYGRDVEYTPEINSSTLANTTGAFMKTYIYPGYVQFDDANDFYYVPNWFKARINVDGTLLNGGSSSTDGYPIADQWNHAVREPLEETLFSIHKSVNATRGLDAPEPSLRMLLDAMNDPSNSDYTNSIIINLHGEMVPIVPLRNYSDAAKDPAYFWGGRGGTLSPRAWRAVSHPEYLSYSAGSDVVLRTYAYDMNASSYADPITSTVENDLINYVTVFAPGVSLVTYAPITATGCAPLPVSFSVRELDRMQGNSKNTYGWHRSFSYTAATGSQWQIFYLPTNKFNININTSSYVTVVADAGNTYTARWFATDYSPPGRTDIGVRIVFQGVTPTARACTNTPYVP